MAAERAVERSVAQCRIQRVGVIIEMQNQMMIGEASARRARAFCAFDQASLNALSCSSKLESKRHLLSIDFRSAHPGAGRRDAQQCGWDRTETRCEKYAKQQPEASRLHGQSFGCGIGPAFDVGAGDS